MTEPADPIRPPAPGDWAAPHTGSRPAPPPDSGPPYPGSQYPTQQYPPYGGAPYGGQYSAPPYPGPPPYPPAPYPPGPYPPAPYPGQGPTGYRPPPPGMYGQPPGMYGPPPRYPVAPPAVAPNGQPLAGFGDRLAARLLDGLILGAFAAVLFVPLFIIVSAMANSIQVDDRGHVTNSGPVIVIFLLLYAGWLLLILAGTYVYEVEMMWRTGQTVGKRVMKIRVIPLQPGAPLTRGAAAKRWGVYQLVGAIVPVFSWVDGLWQLWDKPFQQCLHDKAAGTAVVKLTR